MFLFGAQEVSYFLLLSIQVYSLPSCVWISWIGIPIEEGVQKYTRSSLNKLKLGVSDFAIEFDVRWYIMVTWTEEQMQSKTFWINWSQTKLGKTLQSWVSPGKSNSLKSKGEVCSTKSPENDIPSSKSVKISYQDRKKLGRWSFRAVVDQLRAVNLSTSRLLLIDKSWCANHFLASEGKIFTQAGPQIDSISRSLSPGSESVNVSF